MTKEDIENYKWLNRLHTDLYDLDMTSNDVFNLAMKDDNYRVALADLVADYYDRLRDELIFKNPSLL